MTWARDRRLSVQHPTKPLLPTLQPTPIAFRNQDDTQLDQHNPAYPAAVPYHHFTGEFVSGKLSARLWHSCLPCRPAPSSSELNLIPRPQHHPRADYQFHQVRPAYPEHPRLRRIGRPLPARPVFERREPPPRPRTARVCRWGNRGEGRLTLSRS